MSERVLAVSPHPDDAEIGAGGTLARHAARGDDVTIVVATTFPDRTDGQRWDEAARAADILNCDLDVLDVPLDRIEPSRSLVGRVDALLEEYDPDVVYAPWSHDSHQDHRSITETVLAATRKNHRSVYLYERMLPGGITTTGFDPQRFVSITDTIEMKLECLRAHESQVESHGESWLDAVRGRARMRGFQMGTEYAETFEVVTHIDEMSPTEEPRS